MYDSKSQFSFIVVNALMILIVTPVMFYLQSFKKVEWKYTQIPLGIDVIFAIFSFFGAIAAAYSSISSDVCSNDTLTEMCETSCGSLSASVALTFFLWALFSASGITEFYILRNGNNNTPVKDAASPVVEQNVEVPETPMCDFKVIQISPP